MLFHVYINSLSVFAQINDSTSIAKDVTPYFEMILWMVILFLLMCIVCAIALIVILVFSIPKLFSERIISTSVRIALNKRTHAFRFLRFVFSASVISGIIAGVICFSIANDIAHWWRPGTAFTIGAIGGIVAGITVGCLAILIIRTSAKTVKHHISKGVSTIRGRLKKK